MISQSARLLSRTVRCLTNWRNMRWAALSALGAVLWLWFGYSVGWTFFIVFFVSQITGGWHYTSIVIKTFPRDFSALIVLIKSKYLMRKYTQNKESVATLFAKTVKKHPDKVAFIEVGGRQWTFREVDEYSNAIGNYLHESGYRRDDVIAMFMESQPEYVCFWLGMAKIGVIPALINFNLRKESLAHCVTAGNAKAIIYGAQFTSVMAEARSLLPNDIKFYRFGDSEVNGLPSIHINPLISSSLNVPPPCDRRTEFSEKLFYIYTSGTTGLPKPAIVINSRFFYMCFSVHNFFKMQATEIIYDTLPLYHTAGCILGTGQALLMGCTVVIRKKFSASNFWDDCVRYNCTAVQYIGEICRYVLAQPHKPTDRQHRVRVAYGNGLRPQIWTQFTQRFGIERIGEFYGATEGNANIINNDNKVGAIGFLPRSVQSLYPVTLVRVDEATGELLRDRDGLCIKCEPGQIGEMVGKIIKGDPLREFDGYVNKEASQKKITYDVFEKGDKAFMTGDVLEMDELGYIYFRDRTGDTFRWKGENVSTSEIEATISNIVKLNDAVAYGVEIPDMEGRACMVAIVDEHEKLDLVMLYKKLQESLPPYARPLFVRILKELDTTGTFKIKKVNYKKEGFNPSDIKDKLYYFDAKKGGYQPLSKVEYDQICAGKIRL